MTAAIQVDDRSVIEALNRLLAAGTDPRPWLATIGNDNAETTRLRIREGHSPDGSPFLPLSPVTLARRRKKGRGAKPLLDTGEFATTIHSTLGPDYVEWGPNKPQGRMLQFGAAQGAFGRTSRGGPIPWGDVPGRAYLGLSIDDRASALEVFAEAAGVAA